MSAQVHVRDGYVLLGDRQVAKLNGRTVDEIRKAFFPNGELQTRKHPTEPNNRQVRVERGWVDEV